MRTKMDGTTYLHFCRGAVEAPTIILNSSADLYCFGHSDSQYAVLILS